MAFPTNNPGGRDGRDNRVAMAATAVTATTAVCASHASSRSTASPGRQGGRRFSFTALRVIGDGNGRVGLGYASQGVPSPSRRAPRTPSATSSRSDGRQHHHHPVLGATGGARS